MAYNGTKRQNGGPSIRDRQLIEEIPKTERTSICVNRVEMDNGEINIDIRNWYTTQLDPDTPRPSQKGIWLRVEDAYKVAQAITRYYKGSVEGNIKGGGAHES